MTQQRSHWKSSTGFILAAAGSAVGVGNLWKFPYITWENNGGAFVLIYLLCIPLIGLPIMMAEFIIGRHTQKSAVPALAQLGATTFGGDRWKIIGWVGVVAAAVILSYIAVIAGWAVALFVQCVDWSLTGYTAPSENAFGDFLANTSLQFVFAFFFSAATVVIVCKGVVDGIERANRILMPGLFVMIMFLVCYAVTMDGFGEAIGFLFNPRFDALSDQAILEALGHAFFSLSLGMSIMITYGSYLKRSDSIPRAATIIVGLDTLVALSACVIMYSILFTFPELQSSVSKSATGMLFTTLPPLFYAKMSGGVILGPIFYLLIMFAALSSSISLLEVVVALLIDRFSFSRVKATLVSGTLVFILTVLVVLSLDPANGLSRFQLFGTDESGLFYQLNQLFFRGKAGFFNFLDHLVANWLLPFGGLCITLFTGWFLDKKLCVEELGFIGQDGKPLIWFTCFRVIIRFIAPLAIMYVLYTVITGAADFT